jgi:hypothetical protein
MKGFIVVQYTMMVEMKVIKSGDSRSILIESSEGMIVLGIFSTDYQKNTDK